MPDRSTQDILIEIDATLDRLRGSNTATIREQRELFSKRIARLAANDVLTLAKAVFRPDDILHRWFAYELLHYHRAALRCVREKELEYFGNGMASWMDVDSFGCYISGVAWREGQVTDRVIHRWAKSKDRWWRRAALVSTVPLNNRARGGKGDLERTLAVCLLLMQDRDDMVVKAMSWALRQISFHFPKETAQFLAKHKSELAPRVIREVGNKLKTGLKNPRRTKAAKILD